MSSPALLTASPLTAPPASPIVPSADAAIPDPPGTTPGRAYQAIVSRLRAAGCVFAEEEAELLVSAAADAAELSSMVERRVAGLPLEYLLGWADFCGLRVAVTPGVFVPRARTALLVRRAAALANRPGAVVVDLCCGSGAVGAAIAAAVGASSGGPIRLYAVDVNATAVDCARRNLAPIGGRVYRGDLYTPLPARLRRGIDVLVANVPYVPTGMLPLLAPEARLHEPRVALDGGPDGLDLVRRVAAEAADWLAPDGHLLIETSARQADAAAAILARGGLRARVVSDEDLDATVLIGSLTPSAHGRRPGRRGGPGAGAHR